MTRRLLIQFIWISFYQFNGILVHVYNYKLDWKSEENEDTHYRAFLFLNIYDTLGILPNMMILSMEQDYLTVKKTHLELCYTKPEIFSEQVLW